MKEAVWGKKAILRVEALIVVILLVELLTKNGQFFSHQQIVQLKFIYSTRKQHKLHRLMVQSVKSGYLYTIIAKLQRIF